MKYRDYQVVDFIKDDFFVEWIKNPNTESNSFWQEYIAANTDQIQTIKQAREFITSISYDDHQPLTGEEYIEIFESILKPSKQSTWGVNKKLVRQSLQLAATISIVFVLSVLYRQIITKESPQNGAPLAAIIKENPRGQKSTSILPDGTKISLNAESQLIIDPTYGINKRKVHLVGEAFFDVAPDKSKPFIIKTGKVETKVLGTSFNIRSFVNEDNIEILVVSGEVSVSDTLGNSILLNPNELLEYDYRNSMIKMTIHKNLIPYIGWKDGILAFEDDEFKQVIDKIEQWYDVKIIMEKNSQIHGKYTAEYNNKSLEKVMDGWSYASGFSYTLSKDNTVKLTMNP